MSASHPGTVSYNRQGSQQDRIFGRLDSDFHLIDISQTCLESSQWNFGAVGRMGTGGRQRHDRLKANPAGGHRRRLISLSRFSGFREVGGSSVM